MVIPHVCYAIIIQIIESRVEQDLFMALTVCVNLTHFAAAAAAI